MLKYNLNLDIVTLQYIHTALEDKEEDAREEGDEKKAFEYYKSRKEVEAQLERQGIEFVK